MLPDVTPAGPVAAKPSVRTPALPLIERLLKVARPLALVVAVSVPPSVPPPLASGGGQPPCATGLFAASLSWIAGCWANATPLCALLDGCVAIVSFVAAPAPRVILPETTEVSPDALKVMV